jgi:hypothetical protein
MSQRAAPVEINGKMVFIFPTMPTAIHHIGWCASKEKNSRTICCQKGNYEMVLTPRHRK